MSNLITLYIQDVMSGLKEIQPLFDGKISSLKSEMNSWAGISGWPTYGSSGSSASRLQLHECGTKSDLSNADVVGPFHR